MEGEGVFVVRAGEGGHGENERDRTTGVEIKTGKTPGLWQTVATRRRTCYMQYQQDSYEYSNLLALFLYDSPFFLSMYGKTK